MKFKDPLSSLYHLGGSFPNHLTMAVYGGVTWFYHQVQIECTNGVVLADIDAWYVRIKYMFIAHIMHLMLYIFSSLISEKNMYSLYIKKFFLLVSTTLYFAAYLNIQLQQFKPIPDDIQVCIDSSPSNTKNAEFLQSYSDFECFIFYA